jgi:hypothetical protein
MVKRLRFQDIRKAGHRRDREPRGTWVLEPMDMVLAAIGIAVLLGFSVVLAR